MVITSPEPEFTKEKARSRPCLFPVASFWFYRLITSTRSAYSPAISAVTLEVVGFSCECFVNSSAFISKMPIRRALKFLTCSFMGCFLG